MDESRYESARLCDRLAHLDLVTNGDDWLCRGSDMLGYGNIYGRRRRKHLCLALTRDFAVMRMNSAY
jgi:hypothetical protein